MGRGLKYKKQTNHGCNIAIVGATGAVGKEIIRCLENNIMKVNTLKLFASRKSIGQTVDFKGSILKIEEVTHNSFDGVDYLFFASHNEITELYYEQALNSGVTIIDNSSFFRLKDDIPLIVPEVNIMSININDRIIANPNCVATILSVGLYPLHRKNSIRRLIITTFQAASGAGEEAMKELMESTKSYIEGVGFSPRIFKKPYAFNLFSHDSEMDINSGYNSEESKIIAELKKIFTAPELLINITCIRVPILRAHTMTVNIEFEDPFDDNNVRQILLNTPGVKVVDDRERNIFPMPSDATNQYDILVGRIRNDISDPSGKTLNLMVSGDQLLKGAALNAVQIASYVESMS